METISSNEEVLGLDHMLQLIEQAYALQRSVYDLKVIETRIENIQDELGEMGITVHPEAFTDMELFNEECYALIKKSMEKLINEAQPNTTTESDSETDSEGLN